MVHAATRLHFGFGRNAVDVERQPERQLAYRLLDHRAEARADHRARQC